jgi:hypothetical protein
MMETSTFFRGIARQPMPHHHAKVHSGFAGSERRPNSTLICLKDNN